MLISDDSYNHWAYDIAKRAVDLFGNTQKICAGWSPSGIYHIGNSREAVTCNAINKILLEMGVDSKFLFVIDDFDPLDKIPKDMKDISKKLRPYLGHPINRIPDFYETTTSYAQYFAQGAIQAMEDYGIPTEFVYASDLYAQGKYDPFVKIYFEKSKELDQLMESISGSALDSYLTVVCQNCGNLKTTTVTKVEYETIYYTCTHNGMYRGCGNESSMELNTHEWKLKWRLDWPARQTFLGVTVEPSGKDHSMAGGSVDTALAIHEQILDRKPPILERYGFITFGGKKLSGSKGGALPANRVASIMPPSAYLFLVYRFDLTKDIDFKPQSMEYAKLLDEFDVARSMLQGVEFPGREREREKLITAVQLSMFENEKGFIPANIKFEELALVYQTSLRNPDLTIQKLEAMGKIGSEKAKEELYRRLTLLENWLNELAPENIKIKFLETPPEGIEQYWTADVLAVWKETLLEIDDQTTSDKFTKILRDKGAEHGLSPKQYYQPFYQMLLGSNAGPNAANLALALGKDALLKRIELIEKCLE